MPYLIRDKICTQAFVFDTFVTKNISFINFFRNSELYRALQRPSVSERIEGRYASAIQQSSRRRFRLLDRVLCSHHVRRISDLWWLHSRLRSQQLCRLGRVGHIRSLRHRPSPVDWLSVHLFRSQRRHFRPTKG